MKHSVNTSKYVRSHGKEPRGNGMWLFGDYSEKWIFTFCGSYTEAKKAALKAAASHDEFPAIYPLP